MQTYHSRQTHPCSININAISTSCCYFCCVAQNRSATRFSNVIRLLVIASCSNNLTVTISVGRTKQTKKRHEIISLGAIYNANIQSKVVVYSRKKTRKRRSGKLYTWSQQAAGRISLLSVIYRFNVQVWQSLVVPPCQRESINMNWTDVIIRGCAAPEARREHAQ